MVDLEEVERVRLRRLLLQVDPSGVRDDLEAAWKWVDPIREAWERSSEPPQSYVAGTWGPSGSHALIERDGRTWHEDEN